MDGRAQRSFCGSACLNGADAGRLGDAVLLAKDALGISEPGESLIEIRKKYKARGFSRSPKQR